MAKRGRPKKYTEDVLLSIKDKLNEYIKDTKIPIIAEFAYQNDIPRDALYKNEELKYTIKKLIDKKEAQLEKLALNREINHGMAIFSLKQLGWKDVQEVEVGSKDKTLKVEFV